MILVSDVHGAFEALARLMTADAEVLILGDLANLTDYRTGEGAVADVLGIDFARSTAEARASGDFHKMRELWAHKVGKDSEQVRRAIVDAIDQQYVAVSTVMENGSGYVIHGNVDRPTRLKEALPASFRYVHGESMDIDGRRFGFVGGGVATPMEAEGEVSDEEMESLLDGIGPVEVLCTHVPAAVRSLRRDVITGRDERGSDPIKTYLKTHQPQFHFYGDVHQAQATTWRVGATRCINAGYFRATGRFLELDGPVVQARSLD